MADAFTFLGYSLPTLISISASLVVSLYIAYRKALPVPLEGIPYNKEAANSILGDVGPVVKHVGATKEIMNFFTLQVGF